MYILWKDPTRKLVRHPSPCMSADLSCDEKYSLSNFQIHKTVLVTLGPTLYSECLGLELFFNWSLSLSTPSFTPCPLETHIAFGTLIFLSVQSP